MGTIADKLNLLLNTKSAIKNAIIAKGQAVADTDPFSAYADKIAAIQTGVTLPTLTNPGTAADLLSGKQLIDGDGNVVNGSIASRTASSLTASGATVTVPAGHYAAQASKSVATATQATPGITVSSAGLITASATQTAGYVAAGTKSATKQLTTQAAQTITPGTADQTIASGQYLTGTQTILGDANLVAENIKSGVSIFGVAGALSGGNFYRERVSLSEDNVISVTCGFEGSGVLLINTGISNYQYTASSSYDNQVALIFYHADGYYYEGRVAISNENLFISRRTAATFPKYYNVSFTPTTVTISIVDSTYCFDGDYDVFVF